MALNWTPRSAALDGLVYARACFEGEYGTIICTDGSDTFRWIEGTNSWFHIPTGAIPNGPLIQPEICTYPLFPGYVLLFGGFRYSSGDLENRTFKFDGPSQTWQELFPATNPTGRQGTRMVWDDTDNTILMYGGSGPGYYGPPYGGPPNLSDTWKWNGTNWIEQFPVNNPGNRDLYALGFCSGKVVLFGGDQKLGIGINNQTWTWDGTNWTLESPATSPSARLHLNMSSDRARDKLVLFGGSNATNTATLNDTWEWDGTNWTQYFPATVPLARSQHDVVYNYVTERTLSVGGNGTFGTQHTMTFDLTVPPAAFYPYVSFFFDKKFSLARETGLPGDNNDSWYDATLLTGTSGSIDGDNLDFTFEDGTEYSYSGNNTCSAWYKFTAPSNGNLTLETSPGPGTPMDSDDTVLVVFYDTGWTYPDDWYDEDDDGGAGAYSLLTVSVTSGETYYIQITPYYDYGGSFTLTWDFV